MQRAAQKKEPLLAAACKCRNTDLWRCLNIWRACRVGRTSFDNHSKALDTGRSDLCRHVLIPLSYNSGFYLCDTAQYSIIHHVLSSDDDSFVTGGVKDIVDML
jgi:hypothetical protein